MECAICCDTKQLLNLYCQCPICSYCLLKTLDTKHYQVFQETQCPNQCGQKYTVQELLNEVNGLDDLLLQKYLKTQSDIRLCPKNNCNYGGIYLQNCHNYECYCGHQYIIQQEKWNLITFLLNLFQIRECPNCERNISKNGGCNHMTCKCQYEFCWICMQQYKIHSKTICYSNLTIKFGILFIMILTLCYQTGLLESFITLLLIVIKLMIFNCSIMFLLLGVNELYQIQKLNIECNKFYIYGNETFKRRINEKWAMFLILMIQFGILCFLFYLFYQEKFLETYCYHFFSELTCLIIVGITYKIRSIRK